MIDFSHRNSLFCLLATYTTVLVNVMSVAVAVLHESETAMKKVKTQLTIPIWKDNLQLDYKVK